MSLVSETSVRVLSRLSDLPSIVAAMSGIGGEGTTVLERIV